MDSGTHLGARIIIVAHPMPEALLRSWKNINSQHQGVGGPETQATLLQISWNFNLAKLCTWGACSQHKFQCSLLLPQEPFLCSLPGLLVIVGHLPKLGALRPRPRQLGPGEGTARWRLDSWRVLHIHLPSLPWAVFQVLGEEGAGLQSQGSWGRGLRLGLWPREWVRGPLDSPCKGPTMLGSWVWQVRCQPPSFSPLGCTFGVGLP